MNPWAITDTFQLIDTVSKIKQPASYILDTLFPNVMQVSNSSYVAVEYRKAHRRLAPFVVKGAKGVNMSRERSQVKLYSCPMLAPRRCWRKT